MCIPHPALIYKARTRRLSVIVRNKLSTNIWTAINYQLSEYSKHTQAYPEVSPYHDFSWSPGLSPRCSLRISLFSAFIANNCQGIPPRFVKAVNYCLVKIATRSFSKFLSSHYTFSNFFFIFQALKGAKQLVCPECRPPVDDRIQLARCLFWHNSSFR